MTVPSQENQQQNTTPPKENDKEFNFRAQQAKYERLLEQERAARLKAEQDAQEALSKKASNDDDDDDTEPYVDKKRLNKTLNKFGEQTKQQTQSEIQKAVNMALNEERKQNWMKQNADFYDVMQHAEKLYQKDPELAETILEMPEGFERQKLVYKNIKALGLHKPEEKKTSIQEKVDANKRSPYYQPSQMGTAPYSQVADFSEGGQKQAYQKMKELQKQMRL